jgi:hypothetical protein
MNQAFVEQVLQCRFPVQGLSGAELCMHMLMNYGWEAEEHESIANDGGNFRELESGFLPSQCIELDISSAYPSAPGGFTKLYKETTPGANAVYEICKRFRLFRKDAQAKGDEVLAFKSKDCINKFIGRISRILPRVRNEIVRITNQFIKDLADFISGYRGYDEETQRVTSYRIVAIISDSVMFTVSKECEENGHVSILNEDARRILAHANEMHDSVFRVKMEQNLYCLWLHKKKQLGFSMKLSSGKDTVSHGLSERGFPCKLCKGTSPLQEWFKCFMLKQLLDMCKGCDAYMITALGRSVHETPAWKSLQTENMTKEMEKCIHEKSSTDVQKAKALVLSILNPDRAKESVACKLVDTYTCFACGKKATIQENRGGVDPLHSECVKRCQFLYGVID